MRDQPSARRLFVIVPAIACLAGCITASTTKLTTTTSEASTIVVPSLAGVTVPKVTGGVDAAKACVIVSQLDTDVASESPFPVNQAQALASQAFTYAQAADFANATDWHNLSTVIFNLDTDTRSTAWVQGNGLNSTALTTADDDCTPVLAGKST